jgi:hypothetical protein
LSTYINNLCISGQASPESSSLLLGQLLLWSTWCPSAFFSLSLGTVSLLSSCVFFPVACALVLSMQGYIFWSPFMSESTPLCKILKETFMLLALLTCLASRVSFYSGIRCGWQCHYAVLSPSILSPNQLTHVLSVAVHVWFSGHRVVTCVSSYYLGHFVPITSE